jgi:hypothetical protein
MKTDGLQKKRERQMPQIRGVERHILRLARQAAGSGSGNRALASAQRYRKFYETKLSLAACGWRWCWAPAAGESSATTLDSRRRHTIWLNDGGFSRHFHRNAGYNENNLGLGIEYRTSPDLTWRAAITAAFARTRLTRLWC